ncbi:unnamed protein product [Effrenium voratum]|uniref:Fe2OG dioxygenase domain-containing protein n=1 Tax=Effrenium voratum TaxID=2562239 RepID=A0AA36HKJ9_9DINO|nr:unnamed protein product [Effrenium voratum]
MQGGFLEKAISKEASERSKELEAGKKEWEEELLETSVQVLAELLQENGRRAKNDLERRVRGGTGVREFKGKCCGALDDPTPEAEQDAAYRLIEEFTRPSALRDMAGTVMEWAAEIFGNVKRKGAAAGQTMDAETEVQVMRDVVKECLIRHVLKLINATNSGAHAAGSHDAGLLATPQGYTAGDLENLGVDCIKGLMEKGYGIQEDFLSAGLTEDVFRELEMVDFDGKLSAVAQQKMTGFRSDKICWVNFEGLDREKQPGLLELFKKMISLPFELNKKCKLYLQASGSFQIGCYPKQAFYKKHIDGGYEAKLNNGRKVTAIFYANKGWGAKDGGELRVYRRRPNPYQLEQGAEEPKEDEVEEDIAPEAGRLVLFRSRDVPHEVLSTARKRFAVTLWLPGPAGPGDT